MNAEVEVRQQLADATRKLEMYQSCFGDAVDVPPDVQQLSSQLRIKEEELQTLRLTEKQRAQVSGLL
jgi:E3 ubiquitin-protein ligase BRE1